MENKLKEILENKNYSYLGIRGDDEDYTIGDIMGTSYVWNFEEDRTTQGHEDEEESGGVCTTIVTDKYDDWNTPFSTEESFDTVEELVKGIFAALEFARSEQSGYNNYYLVGSNERNPEDMPETDEYEAILADAEVLYKF